jgi:hypothetical protein
MRTCERTREIDVALLPCAQDRDSGAAAQDREDAKHQENQRHSADSADHASSPDARLLQRAIGWEVGEERVEFTVGSCCVQRFKPLAKLVLAEPSLSRRVMQPFDDLLPIGV